MKTLGSAPSGRQDAGLLSWLPGKLARQATKAATHGEKGDGLLCYILPTASAGGQQDAGLLSWLGGVVAEAVRAAEEAEATGAAVAAHRAAIQRAYRLADLQVFMLTPLDSVWPVQSGQRALHHSWQVWQRK